MRTSCACKRRCARCARRRASSEEKGVYYLNVAEAVQDENGFLPGDATPDGMHLTAEYCKIWMEYLRTHTV